MWIGPLLPAITWAVQMQLNYWLLRGACARASNAGLYVTSVIAVVLVCIAGLGCWLAWRRLRQLWPSAYRDDDVRNRFLAVLGLLMAGMFLLAIIAQAVATIVFDPCQS